MQTLSLQLCPAMLDGFLLETHSKERRPLLCEHLPLFVLSLIPNQYLTTKRRWKWECDYSGLITEQTLCNNHQ